MVTLLNEFWTQHLSYFSSNSHTQTFHIVSRYCELLLLYFCFIWDFLGNRMGKICFVHAILDVSFEMMLICEWEFWQRLGNSGQENLNILIVVDDIKFNYLMKELLRVYSYNMTHVFRFRFLMKKPLTKIVFILNHYYQKVQLLFNFNWFWLYSYIFWYE